MCNSRNSVASESKKMVFFTRFLQIILFLVFMSALYLVISFKPLTKEEQIEDFESMNVHVEPFRKNLTECAKQVKASMEDVQNFLRRIPQSNMQGKCFVACVLKRSGLIVNNKINKENLIKSNNDVFGDNSDIMDRLKEALIECGEAVEGIFEICEYASIFNDCMHMRMQHVLDKALMDRRMEALGQMPSDPDTWGEEDDEMMKLVKDEL